jgi:hypothetical protein
VKYFGGQQTLVNVSENTNNFVEFNKLVGDSISARGQGSATVAAGAHAEFGSLKAHITGLMSASNGLGDETGGAQIGPDANVVSASYRDIVRLGSDGDAPPGTLVVLNAIAGITGTFNMAAEAIGADHTARVNASANVRGDGALANVLNSYVAYAVETFPKTDSQKVIPPETFSFQTIMVVGQEYQWGVILEVAGSGSVDSGCRSGNCAGSADGHFGADFSRTVTWGGITKVTNAATGEPILDWTITSLSGFDYSRSYLVPEPASILIIGLGLCGWLGVRRQR